MSLRARSTVGAVLVAAGLLASIWAMAFNWPALLGACGAAVAAGVVLIVLAFRTVAREIADSRAKYDALLRAEIPPAKKDAPPPPGPAA